MLVGSPCCPPTLSFWDKLFEFKFKTQVWRTSTSEFVRTLHGHRRGIACLQYRGNHVVSGSSDNTIRIWDIELGACLRLLEGHDDLVRCIRFDDKRIVSGAYDG